MLPGPVHFTLRGIPTPPAARRDDEAQETDVATRPPRSSRLTDEARSKAHHGWIDMLLGDTSLDDKFRGDG